MLTFFVFLCGLLGLVSVCRIGLNLSIRFWPKVNAKVTSCDINTMTSSVISNLTVHSLSVVFEYEYKGLVYHKGRATLSGAITDKSLEKLIKRKEEILSKQSKAGVSPFFHSFAVLYPDSFEVKLLHYFLAVFGFGIAALIWFFERVLFAF